LLVLDGQQGEPLGLFTVLVLICRIWLRSIHEDDFTGLATPERPRQARPSLDDADLAPMKRIDLRHAATRTRLCAE
jgi:hypothetical protein